MQIDEIYDKLKSRFNEAILDMPEVKAGDRFINILHENLYEVAMYLRDDSELQFDYMMCLSGIDAGKELAVTYHIYSYKFDHKIIIKTTVSKDNPKVPSLERVWRTADWHEREAWDMYGIEFTGHHNLIRILNPYDWEGYPLRKDYKTPEFYHDMKVPY